MDLETDPYFAPIDNVRAALASYGFSADEIERLSNTGAREALADAQRAECERWSRA